jgi:DNA-binding transcriptional ArsR family regulator
MELSSAAPSPGGKSRLPAAIAVNLEPRLEHSLDNRVRREILRVLLGKHPQSANEITMGVSQSSVSAVRYHLGVLRSCGCIIVTATQGLRDPQQHLYAPSITDDEQIISVLRQTRKLDQCAAPHRRFPKSRNPLSPRRLLSIQLGRHGK